MLRSRREKKKKKRTLEMVANEIKLEFEYKYIYMHSLLISLPILMYKTFDTIEFIALIHNKCSICESQKVSSS